MNAFTGIRNQANLGIIPFFIVNLAASPTSVTGGASSVGTVQINQPPDTKTGAIKIALTSSSSATSMPASVTIPVGSTSATFTISTTPVPTTVQAGFAATYNGGQTTASLTVNAPTLRAFVLTPTKIIGGKGHNVTGGVELTGPAPAGGVTVSLSKSRTDVITIPASVFIPAGRLQATFTITTAKVTANTGATVYASAGGTQLSAGVLVEK